MIRIDTTNRIAEVTITGAIDFGTAFEEWILPVFEHPDFVDGMDCLYDIRAATFDKASSDSAMLQAFAAQLAPHGHRLARRVAVVVSTDVQFGLIRMWEGHADGVVPTEFHIFRDPDEARDWLLAARE